MMRRETETRNRPARRRVRGESRRDVALSYAGLIVHNIGVKKLRLALTVVAIAVGVMAVLSLGVVSHSIQSSALAILQTGQADFTIAQKGVGDIVNSSIDATTLPKVAAMPGVSSVTGVLISTTRVNAANPLFLEIGIQPSDLAPFGVTIVGGRAFGASASNEAIIGWRAADNLCLRVGSSIELNSYRYRIVGIYSTGQALGDSGAMLPLNWFQAEQRQSGVLTLLFVRTTPGTNIDHLQSAIDSKFPQLVTIRTIAQFGRADRSLSLINAVNNASTVLAIVIGAIVVLSAMSMSFVERMREFGILAAIGWPRRRVMAMIMTETLVIGLIGALLGLALSFIAIVSLENLPSLAGVLTPDYSPSIFGRALATAAAMSVLGGLYPALRAAFTAPIDELRYE